MQAMLRGRGSGGRTVTPLTGALALGCGLFETRPERVELLDHTGDDVVRSGTRQRLGQRGDVNDVLPFSTPRRKSLKNISFMIGRLPKR
ncbi:MAG: hypothetical protein R3D69_16865 [Xanthobacteraceae bacterium]